MQLSISLLFALMLLSPLSLSASVIFEDNFDDHSDWSPVQPTYGGALTSNDGNATSACTNCPDGSARYAGFRVARTGFDGGRIGNNTMSIGPENAYGGTGKAFTYTVEPVESTLCEDWCNDGLLVKQLEGNYDEIYVRERIKFDTSWTFDDDATSQIKMNHFQHWWDGSFWDYFKDGASWPTNVPTFVEEYGVWGGQGVYRLHVRKQSCYYPSDGYDDMPDDIANDFFRYGISDDTLNCTLGTNCKTWNETLMDGNWHVLEQRLKGNSSMGVDDGIWEVWLDGVKIISKTNIIWADRGQNADGLTACTDCSGSVVDPPSSFVGWNMVILGGNSFIEMYPNTSSTDVEQWYAIDDFVVSTTYIGPDYVIGSSAGPTRSSGSPTGVQTAGTTSVTISVTTDVAAECRYGDDGDNTTPYASLTNVMTDTSNVHTATITGLVDGGSYSRSIRCAKDSDSEANDTDFTLMWSVASAGAICDQQHLNLCTTEGDCTGAGGHYCSDTCQAAVCGSGSQVQLNVGNSQMANIGIGNSQIIIQ